jgi:transmembrane sensor
VLLDAAARIVVDEVSASALAVRMPSGRARFEVVPNVERQFRVASGEVIVEVLGTSFELTREGARTRVDVLRGRVAVRWSWGATELSAGESEWFPPRMPAAVVAERSAVDAARADAAVEPAPRRRAGGAGVSWREHAEEGDFGRAYELLQRAEQRVADDVQELLLAADAARLSGHPAQAVPFLRRVIERHDDDPRASLAAFTLGGVLMNQLGRPREAEAAYARAHALSLSDALAQDAVARQVEAAHRAGDTARARTLALEYLERYPKGRRVNAVRRFGGLP